MINDFMADKLVEFAQYVWGQVVRQTRTGNQIVGGNKMTDQDIVIYSIMVLVATLELTLKDNPNGPLGRATIAQWILEGKISQLEN